MLIKWSYRPPPPIMLTFEPIMVIVHWACSRISSKHMMPIAKYLLDFGAHMITLFIVKVKILVFVKWSYRSPPIMLSLQWLTYFAHTNAISFKHMMSFWYPFLDPHPTQYGCHTFFRCWIDTGPHYTKVRFSLAMAFSWILVQGRRLHLQLGNDEVATRWQLGTWLCLAFTQSRTLEMFLQL